MVESGGLVLRNWLEVSIMWSSKRPGSWDP